MALQQHAEKQKEFSLGDRDFDFIRALVNERTGIVLSPLKRDMVYGRLSRRLRELNMTSFSEYCTLLKDGDESELVEFTNALTTNLTSFFRENHHFEHLQQNVFPMLQKMNSATKRIRIWSAGCSSGEEPYSIAMCVRESFPNLRDWDVRILATDLDSNMVERASSGIYTRERVEGLSAERLGKWVKLGKGDNQHLVRMSDKLREIITFKQLNLLHDWPMRGPFDIIFCRNVVIYFNKETQKTLFQRYASLMQPGSHLFIGHSESLYKVSSQFNLLGKTIYQRNET